MLPAWLGEGECSGGGGLALNVTLFTIGFPGLGYLSIRCTNEITKKTFPVPYGKEEKEGLFVESLLCARHPTGDA